jgi:transposase
MITRAPRIPALKRNKLIKCFAMDIDATAAGELAKVSRPCANRWYRHFRELIYESSRQAPRFFGEVEMDQSEFGGMGSKRLKTLLARYKKVLTYDEYQKKAKAARSEHKVLVFGIIQRGGRVYTQIIKRADARTLTPIVRLVVEQGSTVYTDQWRGFTELKVDGYTHHSINHSEEYVNQKGQHSNTIESFWSFAKRRMRKFNGIARTTLPLHLKESEFRYNEKDAAAALKALIKAHELEAKKDRARSAR